MESIREDLASEGFTPEKFLLLIFYAIPLAMAVAIIVLPLVGQSVDQTLAGFGLFLLALAGLIQVTKTGNTTR
ncbi:MAG: hypothetical protein ACXADL_16300 [Candidatus Thorarchaeota archaeon]